MPTTMQKAEGQVASNGEKAKPTRARMLQMFCDTATEVVEKDFHHATESTVITELAIDSLGILEIIGSLERNLRVQIPDESLTGIRTVGDLLDEVEKRLT
jgi:acyl carrier protein